MITQTPAATLLAPGEGSAYWITGDRFTVKVAGEQTENRYAVGENIVQPKVGPPPHLHRREDELFYVIDGQFAFTFKDTTFTAGAGTAVFLPRGIHHTYKNIGATPAKLLLVATPAGFDQFVAAAGESCADCITSPGLGAEQMKKLAAACEEFGVEIYPNWKADKPAAPQARVPEHWVVGLHVRIVLSSEQTNGSFSVAEITAHPGNFVPPHRHDPEDEFFYVVEGVFEFELEGRRITATPGTFIHVPRGSLHGFRNAGHKPAKLIDYHTPGGFDKFFEAAGTPCDDVRKGPPTAPFDLPAFLQVCSQYGMEVPPPPEK
jgi:quercetin dioxygenase-like cupin family protein